MQDTKRGLPSASERPRTQTEVRPKSERPRTQIGPYQLITKIGEGGMGTVWLTKLPGPAGFNKIAVVKELRADLAGSPAFVEMFLNEARLAARLTHPNVVHTYGANEDSGRLYIAMEYLDGQPWSRVRHELWVNRSLPLAIHLKVLVDTLAGLHYAHELRDYDDTPLEVVHRDMSPQNVFVTYDGQVKLVDFGVARAVNSQQQDSTLFVGKLAYSAPEQLKGGALDRRADIFAVGVMLWEALAGRRLTEGQDRSEAVRRRASEPAPPVRQVVPSVPRALADICDRALALDPSDRFATATEFREAILSYQADTSQVVDSAALGQLIANAFRDERKTIQSLIERHLMHPTVPPLAPASQHLIDTVRPPPPADHQTIAADLSELASVSKLQDENAMVDASSSVALRLDRPKRKPLRFLAGAIVLVAVAWTSWTLSRPQTDTVVSSPLPSPQATAAGAVIRTAPGAAPGGALPTQGPVPTVELKISASPAQATIYMDGTPLAGNPFSGRVKADGEMHLIRVTAPGASMQERVVALDRDKILTFELAPQTAAAPAPRPRPRAQGATAEARAPRQPAAPGAPPESEKTAPRKPPAGVDTDVDFDTRITPESAPREIDEEDPY